MAQEHPVHTAVHDMYHCHRQDFLLPMHTDPIKNIKYTCTKKAKPTVVYPLNNFAFHIRILYLW